MKHWVDRQRNILDFTLSSLWRRKGKATALVFVYTLVIFMLASVMLFTHALKREAEIVLRDAPAMMVQRLVAGRHDLIPVSYGKEIEKIRGVISVRPSLWGYYYDSIFGANYTLIVPEEFSYGQGNIAVGSGVANAVTAEEGDTLPFWSYKGEMVSLTIQEVLSPESELVSADLVLISEADFRSLFDLPDGYATNLVVQVGNLRELPIIAAKVRALFPDSRPILRDEILRTYDSVFNWRSGILVVILAGAVLAFIVFAWDKASGLSAEERKEIGILKAIGWETSDVIQMKFWEGAVVSLTSFLTGLLLAYGHVVLGSSVLFEPVLKGWAVIYPEFKLVPFIDAYQIAVLFFLTVVPYTVSTIVPSWRAATADPDSMMRA